MKTNKFPPLIRDFLKKQTNKKSPTQQTNKKSPERVNNAPSKAVLLHCFYTHATNRESDSRHSLTFLGLCADRHPVLPPLSVVEVLPSLCHLRKCARGAELRPDCGNTPSSEVLTARQRSSHSERGPCTAQRCSPARCIYLVATIEPPLFLSRSLCGAHISCCMNREDCAAFHV